MRKRINAEWQERVAAELDRLQEFDEPDVAVSHTTAFNAAAQWLICEIERRGLPFRVYNLGAGVKKITTETEVCPCCKRGFVP